METLRAFYYSTGSGWSLDGKVREVLLYEGNLNEYERKAVENYLGDKYSITITH